MEHERFWRMIDEARATGDTAAALERALVGVAASEILGFDAWLWAYRCALRREDLWAAAYMVRGGCSDDGFDYFRGWLIAQGEVAVLRLVRDPEVLAELDDGSMQSEALLYVASKAYETKTGEEMPRDASTTAVIPGVEAWPADRLAPRRKWTRALLRETYPKLWARAAWPEPPAGEITHARFWEIVAEARAQRSAPTSDAIATSLAERLASGSVAELVGFDRWLRAYNVGLMRNDLVLACRVITGRADVDGRARFRGWLIAQGEDVVRAALRDPDALADLTLDVTPACVEVIHAVARAAPKLGTYVGEPEEPAVLPDWPADTGDPAPDRMFTPVALRARLPRLTAQRSDAFLTGPRDPATLDRDERDETAHELIHRATALAAEDDLTTAIEWLDVAVTLEPRTADALLARSRLHLRAGRSDAALADLDAAILKVPHGGGLRMERAKQRLALGRREEALADARAALSYGHAEAGRWLQAASVAPPPVRVRHAKFGEGRVVSVEGKNDQQKLTVAFESGTKTLLRQFVEVIE